MIVTVWCTLAITGMYPALLPQAAAFPVGPVQCRLLQAGVGAGGLGLVELLKVAVGSRLRAKRMQDRKTVESTKAALKALTYVAICAWTFLVSQMVSQRALVLLM